MEWFMDLNSRIGRFLFASTSVRGIRHHKRRGDGMRCGDPSRQHSKVLIARGLGEEEKQENTEK